MRAQRFASFQLLSACCHSMDQRALCAVTRAWSLGTDKPGLAATLQRTLSVPLLESQVVPALLFMRGCVKHRWPRALPNVPDHCHCCRNPTSVALHRCCHHNKRTHTVKQWFCHMVCWGSACLETLHTTLMKAVIGRSFAGIALQAPAECQIGDYQSPGASSLSTPQ